MNGSQLIAAERERQIAKEGWTPEHDDNVHARGDLNAAALAYATAAQHQAMHGRRADFEFVRRMYWPWDAVSWKPSADPAKNLIKAGALIAAEIDRLQRTKR